MKKVLALAAAAALMCGASAFAANPFSDVTPDDWAYQAVSDLSDQGIVEGYPDGTFKGQRNMTRYELAQIIARLMAREDQMNAEQRATVDKLAAEYADELSNLGVRVGNLEKKAGNIYWSGDARVRYQKFSIRRHGNDKESWNARLHINAKAQVNDSTYVFGQLEQTMNFKDGDDGNTTMDRLYVHHDFGDKVGLTLGRYEMDIGNDVNGAWLYGDAFDGAEADFDLGKVGLAAGYGRFRFMGAELGFTNNAAPFRDVMDGDTHRDVYYTRGKADFGFAQLGVDYFHFTKDNGAELIGGTLNVPFGKNFQAFGDFYANTNYDEGCAEGWQAGLGYSNFDWKKPGTFDLSVAYFDVHKGLFKDGEGPETDIMSNSYDQNIKFWNLYGDVALQKNVKLHAEYNFAAQGDRHDPSDAWTVSLKYVW